MIDELSRIDYIRIADHSEMGPVGWVVKFATHQRVDRPNKSKIKPYYLSGTATKPRTCEAFDEHSTNIRRMIDEQSPTEQGTGNREQGTGNRVIDTDVSIVHLDSQTHDPEPENGRNGEQHELPLVIPNELAQKIADLQIHPVTLSGSSAIPAPRGTRADKTTKQDKAKKQPQEGLEPADPYQDKGWPNKTRSRPDKTTKQDKAKKQPQEGL